MKIPHIKHVRILVFVLGLTSLQTAIAIEVGKSPYGPDDEVGLLRGITDTDRIQVLHSVKSGKVYDLSLDFFIGMPGPDSYNKAAPKYSHFYPVPMVPSDRQIGRYFEHDAPEGVGAVDDSITMTLHHGTQIDSFAHVHYKGQIYNGFKESEHFGLEGWERGGAEKIPPIIGHGIMIDVAAFKGLERLPPEYSITIEDLQQTLKAQNTQLQKNTIVFIRTGLMSVWPNADELYAPNPGLTVASAGWLVDQGAVLIGGDNTSLERTPLQDQSVHIHLLVERGVNLIEQLNLEALSKDKIYEFLAIALPLKFRGGAGSPIRVIAVQ